eukprot:10621317-Lingulodinium_polyedra.AAC.1
MSAPPRHFPYPIASAWCYSRPAEPPPVRGQLPQNEQGLVAVIAYMRRAARLVEYNPTSASAAERGDSNNN